MVTRDDVDVIVDQWKRELPDMDTRATELFGRIQRLSLLMSDRMNDVCAPYGISCGELEVLAALRRSGEPYRLTPKTLASSMMITTGGMTGRLTKLERAALIKRVPHANDARSSYAELTETGVALVEKVMRAGSAAQSRIADTIGDDTRRLCDLLREALWVTANFR